MIKSNEYIKCFTIDCYKYQVIESLSLGNFCYIYRGF